MSLAILALAGAVCAGQQPVPAPKPPQQAQPNPPRLLPTPGNPSQPYKPPAKPLSPFDPALDVRGAIDAAKTRAQAGGMRVLVIWATDPEGYFTQNLVDLSYTTDMARQLNLEFVPVWADAARGEKAGANRELAKSLGAELKAGELHGALTVLDESGKPVTNAKLADMADEFRKRSYSATKILDFLLANKAPAPAAQALLDGAKARATSEGKCVLLWCGEFDEEWSGKFRQWLAEPGVRVALGKYAVVAPVEMLRATGAMELLASLGCGRVDNLPWWAVLNADGRVVGTSQPESMPNIGFPGHRKGSLTQRGGEADITAFIEALRRGNPKLTDADAKAIRESLGEFLRRKAQ